MHAQKDENSHATRKTESPSFLSLLSFLVIGFFLELLLIPNAYMHDVTRLWQSSIKLRVNTRAEQKFFKLIFCED